MKQNYSRMEFYIFNINLPSQKTFENIIRLDEKLLKESKLMNVLVPNEK